MTALHSSFAKPPGASVQREVLCGHHTEMTNQYPHLWLRRREDLETSIRASFWNPSGNPLDALLKVFPIYGQYRSTICNLSRLCISALPKVIPKKRQVSLIAIPRGLCANCHRFIQTLEKFYHCQFWMKIGSFGSWKVHTMARWHFAMDSYIKTRLSLRRVFGENQPALDTKSSLAPIKAASSSSIRSSMM